MKMSISLIFCFNFFVSNFSLSKSRIRSPVDPAKRCVDKGVDSASCSQMRSQALKIGCITEDEYKVLVRYGAYPSCNLLRGEGLNMLDGWCPCGCFHPMTKIQLVSLKEEQRAWRYAWELAVFKKKESLLTFKNWEFLKPVKFSSQKIIFTTFGEEKRPLRVIETSFGERLKITEEHPVVVYPGKMKKAKDLTKEDQLFHLSGYWIAIASLTKEIFLGEVVNFSTEAKNPFGHILFAEGVAVGDQYWQGSLESEYGKLFSNLQSFEKESR